MAQTFGHTGSKSARTSAFEAGRRQILQAAEPIEAAVFPIAARIVVGHLDRGDPLRILVAELGRGAQPQRIAERIAEIRNPLLRLILPREPGGGLVSELLAHAGEELVEVPLGRIAVRHVHVGANIDADVTIFGA